MSEPPPFDDYELLVEHLMRRLAAVNNVSIERLERPQERLDAASGTTAQIDVLWDFTASDSTRWRVLFEARSYGRRLDQDAVYAFAGKVADIDEASQRRCLGVMITTKGFQSGAQIVGASKNILMLELRRPTPADMTGRIAQIDLTIEAHSPFIDNFTVTGLYGTNESGHASSETAPDPDGLHDPPSNAAAATSRRNFVELEYPDGRVVPINEVLFAGESPPLADAAEWRRRVRRSFEPGHHLLSDGIRVGEIKIVEADIAETVVEHHAQIAGLSTIAWMLRHATGALNVWFSNDGRHWTTT